MKRVLALIVTTMMLLYSINLRIMGKSMLAVSVDKFDLLVSVRNQGSSCLVAFLFVAADNACPVQCVSLLP